MATSWAETPAGSGAIAWAAGAKGLPGVAVREAGGSREGTVVTTSTVFVGAIGLCVALGLGGSSVRVAVGASVAEAVGTLVSEAVGAGGVEVASALISTTTGRKVGVTVGTEGVQPAISKANPRMRTRCLHIGL